MKSLNETLVFIRKKNETTKIFINSILSETHLEDIEINENSTEVLRLIKNDEFETDNPSEFRKSLVSSKHLEMLTDYGVHELSQMKLFKVPGYNIGFALKRRNGKFNEIVAVHNNEPNIKGIGEELMKSAIRIGGEYLDHFDGFLSDFYQKLGFVEYDRDKFNPEYDMDGAFRKKYGEADIIYRKFKNN